MQLMLAKSKPVVADSVMWYVPARTLLKSCSPLSESVNGDATTGVEFVMSWVKLNVPEAPSGVVCLWITIAPQFEMFTGTGAMKSFNSEVNELPEDRLFSVAEPKCVHWLAGKMLAPVRLMAASPNVELMPFFVFPSSVFGPGALVSCTGTLFTAASAEAPRTTALSQQGSVLLASQLLVLPLVIHVCLASTGTPLPPKSKSINRSPAVRAVVTPFAASVEL